MAPTSLAENVTLRKFVNGPPTLKVGSKYIFHATYPGVLGETFAGGLCLTIDDLEEAEINVGKAWDILGHDDGGQEYFGFYRSYDRMGFVCEL